jgi:hypothetical protein
MMGKVRRSTPRPKHSIHAQIAKLHLDLIDKQLAQLRRDLAAGCCSEDERRLVRSQISDAESARAQYERAAGKDERMYRLVEERDMAAGRRVERSNEVATNKATFRRLRKKDEPLR